MKGRFDWKAAYFNLVSLVAMIFFLFAAVTGGRALLQMAFPALSMPEYEWRSVESFTEYKQRYEREPVEIKRPGADEPVPSEDTKKSEEELRRDWEQHKHLALEGQKRNGLWRLFESLATLAVAIPVLLFHRRQAKRLKPEPEPVVTS